MTKEQEQETIKYLEFLQKEYLEDAKRKKENGEITGYGTMEDIDKLRALHIGFALEMLKEKDKEIEKKDKQIDLMAEQLKIPEPTMKIESFDIKPKTKFGMRYLNKEEVKQYFERKVKDEL